MRLTVPGADASRAGRGHPHRAAKGEDGSVVDAAAEGGSTVAGVAAYDLAAEDYAAHFPTTEPEQPGDLDLVRRWAGGLVGGTRTRADVGGVPVVLDAGCGTGRMARYLVDVMPGRVRLAGADPSRGMLAVARREHPWLPVLRASLTALPIADATLDGVLAWYSTIHLTDTEVSQALPEIHRVLRPGGTALLGFQSGEGAREVGAPFRRLGHDVRLVRQHRTPERMTAALAAAGLEVTAAAERAAAGGERDPQAVVVARRGPR